MSATRGPVHAHRRHWLQRATAALATGSALPAAWAPVAAQATTPAAPAACVSTAPDPRAAAALARRLLPALAAAQPTANLALSPASLEAALAVLWLGARGDTRRALATALGLADCAAPGQAAEAGPLKLASRPALSLATAVWTAPDLALQAGFARLAQQCCGASVQRLPNAPVPAINAWVAQATHGRIPRLLDQLSPGLRLLVVNAVHFRAAWALPFDPQATSPGPFQADGGRVLTLPFMRQAGSFQVQRLADHSWLRLGYAGSTVLLDLRMPHAGGHPLALLPLLLADALPAGPPRGRGRLSLPRFKLGTSASLGAALAAAGLGVAFDASRADFSGLVAPGRLAIDELRQSVFLALDEAGTEAAAATSASLVGSAGPAAPAFDLVIDRPFAFALRDAQDGMVLFAGVVQDPSAGTP